jgi:hypothetical protein
MHALSFAAVRVGAAPATPDIFIDFIDAAALPLTLSQRELFVGAP